ncbi:hypothetical protein KIPB_015751, partial [Kipferlia bialata]
ELAGDSNALLPAMGIGEGHVVIGKVKNARVHGLNWQVSVKYQHSKPDVYAYGCDYSSLLNETARKAGRGACSVIKVTRVAQGVIRAEKESKNRADRLMIRPMSRVLVVPSDSLSRREAVMVASKLRRKDIRCK